MPNYKMGFWNYVDTGKLNSEEAVKDWEDLACNLVMSFEYDVEKGHNKQDMLRMLDECQARGIQVIVCDIRTRLGTFKRKGRQAYIDGVADAVKDFGSHPATYGFHIGDEPDGNDIENTIEAYKIVRNAAPTLTPFINFLPIWYNYPDDFKNHLGVSQKDYKALLNRIVREAGLKCIGFDYYGQCNYYNNEQYTKDYFENLVVFGEVARENNIPLFTSLLSVAHQGYKQVSQDDIRWQINTSLAMGTKGILWFYLYERFLDTSFRVPPIDMFGAKTETYHWLARENKVFMKCIAPELKDAEWMGVRTVNYVIPSIQPFQSGDFGIKSISMPLTDRPSGPLLVTQFKKGEDEFIMVVNADKSLPVYIKVDPVDENSMSRRKTWLAPGGLSFYRF